MSVRRSKTRRLLARLPRPVLLAPVVAALAIAGCGSQTKTVSVSATPPQSTQSEAASSSSTTSTTSSTTTTTTSTEASEAQETTTEQTSSRTSSAPAFVEHEEEAAHGALGSAVATVEQAGYVPDETGQYKSSQTLAVLAATKSGASGAGGQSGAYTQQAFFFVDGKYIGTDASQPSASIAVVAQSDTEVVLEYGLYDTAQAPAGHVKIHFQLDDGKLAALDPIPPVRPTARADGRL